MKVTLDYPDLTIFMKEILGLTHVLQIGIEKLEMECECKKFEVSESAALLSKMICCLEKEIMNQETYSNMN